MQFINSIAKKMAIFDEKNEIRERCKGVHCVDLGESFHTHIYLQNLASIQPRMSPPKFGRSPRRAAHHHPWPRHSQLPPRPGRPCRRSTAGTCTSSFSRSRVRWAADGMGGFFRMVAWKIKKSPRQIQCKC